MSEAAENLQDEESTVIETDDLEAQVEDEQQEEVAATDVESEEDEIVLEGEEQPTSNNVPKGFLKRINKLNSRVEAARTESEEEHRRNAMLEEENRLLKLKLSGTTQKAPNPADFDTDEEYEQSKRKYDELQMQAAVKAEAQRIFEDSQERYKQEVMQQETVEALTRHYEKAEGLNISNYEDLEDKAISVLGKDVAKFIMVNSESSHLVLPHLGSRLAKAEKLAKLIRERPGKGLIEVGKIEAGLQVKPRNSTAPEPVNDLPSGGAVKKVEHGPDGATYE